MWFKVDDSFPQHPKVLAIPRRDRTATIGLWTLAGIWCSQQLTDGYLAAHMVTELAGTQKAADLLVKVNLWELAEGGYQIHDYLDYNPSADEVRAEQARKHAAKVAAGRAGGVASGVARRKHARSSDEANAKQNGSKTKPRPDPTRPGTTEMSFEGGSHVSSGADADAPPLYPDHCTDHANDPVPPKCGGCQKQKQLNAATRPALALVEPMRRCLVHDESYVTVCRGCRSEEIAAEETA